MKWDDMPPVGWEADGPERRIRNKSDGIWRCLGCGAEMQEDADGKVKQCPLPSCVELRRSARRRMGLPEAGLPE